MLAASPSKSPGPSNPTLGAAEWSRARADDNVACGDPSLKKERFSQDVALFAQHRDFAPQPADLLILAEQLPVAGKTSVDAWPARAAAWRLHWRSISVAMPSSRDTSLTRRSPNIASRTASKLELVGEPSTPPKR